MAVVYVKKNGISGGDTKSGASRANITEEWSYLVKTTGGSDTSRSVLAHPSIPARNTPHPADPNLLVVSRSASAAFGEKHAEGLYWNVTVGFSNDNQCQIDDPENPLDDPPDIQWGTSRGTRVITADIEGNAILNTAKEPPETGIEIDDARPTLTITRNESTFSTVGQTRYIGTVNENAFFGFQPGEAMCVDIQGRRAYLGCIEYWVVTYVFEFQRNGWQLKLLSQGYNQLLGGEDYEVIVDVNGNPKNTPSLLDADGLELVPGEDPVFLDFEIYPSEDFGELNLE